MRYVLVATNQATAGQEIGLALGKDFKIDLAYDAAGCLEMFRRKRYEFTFIDIDFLIGDCQGRVDFKQTLRPFWQVFPSAHIIALTAQERIREAVSAVKAGASNYLTYPLDAHEISYAIESLSQMTQFESELSYLRNSILRPENIEGVRTNSRAMIEVLDKVRSVAPTRTNVLLTGETGTGKSLLARAIHAQSNRADGPFIAVHCGAIPDTLLESELFGHEKGAFTGAVKRKLGKFQIADSGTIFLDEIGTITPAAQIKLLEVLQEMTFTRVGGEAPIHVDVRVVAASNEDLKARCDQGSFRKDLFYRLNVFPIELPPLRERLEDIPLLVETFLERFNRTHGKDIKGVQPEIMEALNRYSWPGNIRELENVLERAYLLEKGALLSPGGFPGELFTLESFAGPTPMGKIPTLTQVRSRAVDLAEVRYLREVLALNKGRVDQSAAMAGVTTRQLHNLLTKHGIHKEEFK
ncbi:Fis family transcriptional regulator [Desulfocarbo indianensis]|nr:Fis family transcriptional regulator [Desulfocarbo indianensis]